MKDYYVVIEDSWGDSIEISNRGVLPETNDKGVLIGIDSPEVAFSIADLDEFIRQLQKAKEVLSRGRNIDE
ncbi:hypothetical protein CN376_22805 [Bacillus cereus]|uniref:hypothetical protein n=1 Tax=Bacillus cereus TaxID=1396 RepID=UPI000BF982E0|nr:hypothetical protein [Bacillus cereus]PEZ87913.1 hypothetical protein CN376_22805 [Bacillus cereus]PFR12631.1 hypothetical protein COK30_13875 [Bacillus cereus]